MTPGLYFWQRVGKNVHPLFSKDHKVDCSGFMNGVGAMLQFGCGRKQQESHQCLMQDVFQDDSTVRALNDALTMTYCTKALLVLVLS